jgi:glycosyltransferase involved in cell wall biosynthesis
MRFCFVTTFFPPYHFGGDAIFVANLANLLVENGHSVEVVHCADSFELLRGPVQLSPVPLHPSVQVHTLRSSAGPLSPLLTQLTGQPGLKSKTLKSILDKDFDVVHWHNLSLVGGPGALPLGRGVRLCTLHDYWLICPTHILFKSNGTACINRTCVTCTLAHRRPPQLWRLGGYVSRAVTHIDAFIAPSQFVREKYRKSHLAITPLVLPHFFTARTRWPPPVSRDYYFFAGRLEQAKGLQTVIRHFRKSGRRLVIAGSGTYEQELKRQCAGNRQVEFIGRVTYQDLPRWYAGARATIVPSICYETFGLTILESLQQGTPVITSHFGALPETVGATEGGEVYSNAEELEAILTRFDADPEYASRLGERGSANLTPYSPQEHLRSYLEIIDRCRRPNTERPDESGLKDQLCELQ